MRTKVKETVKKAVLAKKPVRKTVSPVAKKERKKRALFSVRAKEGSKVYLAGSFNDWNPTAKKMLDPNGNGVFAVVINLPVGSHEYKFVIDGIWCADPECADWVQNDLGTLNSVKVVD